MTIQTGVRLNSQQPSELVDQIPPRCGNSIGWDKLKSEWAANMGHRLGISNRSACVLAAIGALCCLAGCDQGSAPAPGPVLASSPAAPAADPPSNPGAPAAAPAISAGRAYTTVAPLTVEQQADVVAERDGRVAAVKVEIGDHVRRGEVLALLDDRALQAARAEKAARIGSLNARIQTSQAERSQAERKTNAADLRRAQAMRAEKTLAEAELRTADVALDQSRVKAPFDGVVGRRSVREAQGVRKGDALFWITAQAPLRILFTVPESALAFFPRGAKLELSTADYPHLKQPASVFRVSPVVDRASGNIEVIGNLEKPSPLLKPGMSMQVKLSPR
jgi:RND family efflux transporter MFP subunit